MMDYRAREPFSKKPIRVLFISQDCRVQCYTEQTEYAYWYEGAFDFYSGGRAHVGIAYEMRDDATSGPPPNSSISYYPLKADLRHGATGPEWEAAHHRLLEVINQFEPDIIQCFGSEWPHAAIAEYTDVPVVVHMMGFLNIYYSAIGMATGYAPKQSIRHAVLKKLPYWKHKHDEARASLERNAAFERRVMKSNRFFLGRTDWDRNIVKYYSPGSRYFEVPELIRFPFIRHAGCWRYHFNGKLKLFTLASADDRKGIEIILRAAKLLKELIGIDFEWRIAGNEKGFDRFEKRCGIHHGDVGVRLLGMLEAEDIVYELEAADLFIHASIIDNSPRAICEAQLIGCPVISSIVGGVPQLIEQGVTGFLYPYNEPHALAFLLANLAAQQETLTEVSETATRIAYVRHDPKNIIDRMLNVYKEIIAIHET